MKPRLAAALLALLPAFGPAKSLAARPGPPNIVFLMADELGYYELSCMGHPNIKTPNIDRLAANGVRFTQCLAGSSLCAPTRAALMTGKHSGHTSVRTNGGGTPLRAGEPTIASVLASVGYATGGFGKWGCGGRGSSGVPEKHGFDTFVGYYDQVHAHTYYPAYIIKNSEELPLPGNKGGASGTTYSHYRIVEEAEKFIRANKDRPFFCYLPVTPPHGMFSIPDDDPAWRIYKDEPWPEPARRYAAMVTMVDRQLGELLDLLKELGIAGNTLVVVTGDNGGNDYFADKDHRRGFHAPNVDPKTGVAFRGKKGTLYEGGLRIPVIAYWPGKIPGGRVSDHLSYFPDFMPTFAELAGAEAPADTDGISMVPELFGEPDKQRQHEYLYWELGRQTAVRMGSWKAVQPRNGAAWQLYDLSKDVSEANDVSGEHAGVLAKMKGFAKAAHEPVREGDWGDRTLHEKDRRAVRGGRRRQRRVHTLSGRDLIPRKEWKLVRASSESTSNGKVATNAFDGDPRTHWHTRFGAELARPPHELVIDMGKVHEVRGFAYLARQDGGWNGALGKCEFFVGDSLAAVTNATEPALATEFQKLKTAQRVTCAPVHGRYLRLRILTEVNGGPWASIAELAAIGK